MTYKLYLLVVTAAVFMPGGIAYATAGKVDANGCHNSQKIGYHCHPGKASGGGGAADGSRSDRVKRLKAECKGAVNAGVCTGYTGKH